MQIFTCLRCQHEWPSKKEKPVTCAKCRSPYWDIAKGTVQVVVKNIAEATPVVDRMPTIPAPVERAELSDLQNLINSIHAKKEPQAPWVAPKVEQYDLSEPTLEYD
jgi:hypothetical protein